MFAFGNVKLQVPPGAHKYGAHKLGLVPCRLTMHIELANTCHYEEL